MRTTLLFIDGTSFDRPTGRPTDELGEKGSLLIRLCVSLFGNRPIPFATRLGHERIGVEVGRSRRTRRKTSVRVTRVQRETNEKRDEIEWNLDVHTEQRVEEPVWTLGGFVGNI